MKPIRQLSDDQHPEVQSTASRLTSSIPDPGEKLSRIFHFVRDEIEFGFPPVWDAVKASETLGYQRGYCTTKATLFHALCKASGLESRLHTGLIDVEIMRGIFPDFTYPFLPEYGGHTWTEVRVNGDWKPLDSYINDKALYEIALQRLHASGKQSAFSISEAKGPSSCEFNFGEKGFVHMGAVVEDHGVWDDYSEYMNSDRYIAMGRMQQMTFPLIAALSNRSLARIRGGSA